MLFPIIVPSIHLSITFIQPFIITLVSLCSSSLCLCSSFSKTVSFLYYSFSFFSLHGHYLKCPIVHIPLSTHLSHLLPPPSSFSLHYSICSPCIILIPPSTIIGFPYISTLSNHRCLLSHILLRPLSLHYSISPPCITFIPISSITHENFPYLNAAGVPQSTAGVAKRTASTRPVMFSVL